MTREKTYAVPPKKEPAPRVETAKTVAGGVAAIASSLKHGVSEMGVLRSAQALLKVNQQRGFDCPGCAWPDPDDRRSMVEFCENGAKAVAEEATRKKVEPEFFAAHSVSELSTWSDFELGKAGRLTHPVLLREGENHYAAISWDEAFTLIARELHGLDSPHEAVFYTSGRTSNEAAFLYQLLVRLFGTNNLPDCSNMCHESSGVALNETIGIGKGTVKLEDFDKADAIFIVGQNPGTNHPRMMTALQQAAKNGCRIVTINPLNEAGTNRFIHPQDVLSWAGSGTPLTHLFLQVRINGDVALLKGIVKAVLEREKTSGGKVLDWEFIRAKTEGFEEFAQDIAAEDWQKIVEQSGVNRDAIEQAASIYCEARSVICCWAMGLTQHRNAVGNIQEIVNLLLLRGHFGRPGAGVCPVRGHSNVQGDRTMGIYEKPSAGFLDSLERVFGFSPPRAPGFDTVDAIKAMASGKAKVFFAMGGNFLSATPDTEFTAEALRSCRLTVQVSTKLNRSHVVTGRTAIILPCLGRTDVDVQRCGEQFVSVENSMGVVHSSRGNLRPPSAHLKSEVAIVCELAKKLFEGSARDRIVDWDALRDDYGRIRELIESTIAGFSDYNRRVDAGFYLPNAIRDACEFLTPSKKARFTVHPTSEINLGAGEFIMMTIRSHDQYNTTIYGLDDRYRGVAGGRRVVLMNPRDMEEFGFSQGDEVDVTSHFNAQRREAKGFFIAAYDIPRRCVAAYFPETNVLVPVDSVAEKSNTPTSKSFVVTFTKVTA